MRNNTSNNNIENISKDRNSRKKTQTSKSNCGIEQKKLQFLKESKVDTEHIKILERMHKVKITTERCNQKADKKTALMGFLMRGPWSISELDNQQNNKNPKIGPTVSVDAQDKNITVVNSMLNTKSSFFRVKKAIDTQNFSKSIHNNSLSNDYEKKDRIPIFREKVLYNIFGKNMIY